MGKRGFDQATASQAFARPGQDTRQWVSLGLVDEDQPDAKSVQFKTADGQPLPEGPLVAVTLQPSGVSVVCRVASSCAGNGEGEWYPFVSKDEVVVVIPEGMERCGPIIIARCNNEIDAFPDVVAGQDPTTNTFAFKRLRSPYICESAGAILFRSALTGAQFGLDPTGQLIIGDGEKNSIVMSPSAMGLTSGDGDYLMQINLQDGEVTLAAKDAGLTISPTESRFLSKGTLSFATSGLPGQALGHAITAEQAVILIMATLTSLGTVIPGALVGAAVAGAATGILNGAIPLATTLPLGPFIPAVTAALSTPPDPSGTLPGFGRAGYML
jgi:hypothetical protein